MEPGGAEVRHTAGGDRGRTGFSANGAAGTGRPWRGEKDP